jgi:predicted RNase H-like HicB family nuclease
MLTRYIEAAMRHAETEWLADDGVYYGHIPGLDGVWADGATDAACLTTLREVLEEWIMVSLAHQLPIPAVDGIELQVREVA